MQLFLQNTSSIIFNIFTKTTLLQATIFCLDFCCGLVTGLLISSLTYLTPVSLFLRYSQRDPSGAKLHYNPYLTLFSVFNPQGLPTSLRVEFSCPSPGLLTLTVAPFLGSFSVTCSAPFRSIVLMHLYNLLILVIVCLPVLEYKLQEIHDISTFVH